MADCVAGEHEGLLQHSSKGKKAQLRARSGCTHLLWSPHQQPDVAPVVVFFAPDVL